MYTHFFAKETQQFREATNSCQPIACILARMLSARGPQTGVSVGELRLWKSHVTRMNESCHTYDWVTEHSTVAG